MLCFFENIFLRNEKKNCHIPTECTRIQQNPKCRMLKVRSNSIAKLSSFTVVDHLICVIYCLAVACSCFFSSSFCMFWLYFGAIFPNICYVNVCTNDPMWFSFVSQPCALLFLHVFFSLLEKWTGFFISLGSIGVDGCKKQNNQRCVFIWFLSLSSLFSF